MSHPFEGDPVFDLHLGGKMETVSTVELTGRDELSLAYTPGVALVCEAISILPPTCSAKTGSSSREFSRSGICSDATTKGIPWGDEARRRDRYGLV